MCHDALCQQVREMLERFENIPDMLELDHLTVQSVTSPLARMSLSRLTSTHHVIATLIAVYDNCCAVLQVVMS